MNNDQADQNTMSRTAFVSLSSGVMVIIATLVAVALLNVPRSAVAGGPSQSCPMAEVSLDQGYGVARTVLQPVCRESADAVSGNSIAR